MVCAIALTREFVLGEVGGWAVAEVLIESEDVRAGKKHPTLAREIGVLAFGLLLRDIVIASPPSP